MADSTINTVVLRHHRQDCWLRFTEPLQVVSAWSVDEVKPALKKIQQLVRDGCYAAGFITYEAAPGFDQALITKAPYSLPLLCFGLFHSCEKIQAPAAEQMQLSNTEWQTSLDQHDFSKNITAIKKHLLDGNCYQVNFTMQQRMSFSEDARRLFNHFATDAPYGALIEMDNYTICSSSPELFFDLHQGTIRLRPMKGTAPRGMTQEEDQQNKENLGNSIKDRAENSMILDMIRNDVGKIAIPGSIVVDQLFALEKYPTLWQMTSSVSARTDAPVNKILEALFPCASITGAPKVRTMDIIDSLEHEPRGIYTGCIGLMTPEGDAQFSVAIRTAFVDKDKKEISYGIGAGIVWDSNAEQEYEECKLKARVLDSVHPRFEFSLIETMLWQPEGGFFLLDYHRKRLKASAEYFYFNFADDKFTNLLVELRTDLLGQDPLRKEKEEETRLRVRILLAKDGDFSVAIHPLPPEDHYQQRRVQLSSDVVCTDNPYLYHKTTHRSVYEKALANNPDCDDVILVNQHGQITESTIANVVIRHEGRLITPPISCGLLAGTYRQALLDEGEIVEGIIARETILASNEVYLINSVRRWQRVQLVKD
jgi:para-aminobenzoate synthetase/4-amino-4-deoxychorismate lyase